MHAFRHSPFGEFGDDDRVVDQHADCQDQREQHHDIDGEAREIKPEHAGQERRRDRDADKERSAHTEREQNNDGDEQDRGRNRVLQVREHLADGLRLVLRKRNLDRFRPGLLKLRHDFLHAIDGRDQIFAGALRHFDGHGRMAVDARNRERVLEGRPHFGDVAERDAGAGGRGDGYPQHVFGPLDQRRHLDREAAGFAFECACGDQAVRGAGHGQQLIERDIVALHQRRIGDDLDHFVAGAAQLSGKHARRLFDRVLCGARDPQQACVPARRRKARSRSRDRAKG